MTVGDRHTRGVIYDQEWALTLTATQPWLGQRPQPGWQVTGLHGGPGA